MKCWSRLRLAFCLALSAMMVASAFAWQATSHPARRIYVEPLATQQGSEAFRTSLIAALKKLNTVSLASDEADADLILGGGGQIWIRGYRSHNPELGDGPADGTPIYTGFLSIELRDKDGQTLWSYLATPPAASRDVARDVSALIAKKLAEAIKQGMAVPPTSPLPQPAVVLKGAGATFPYPVYEKWLKNYRRDNPAVAITYDPIGSAAGVSELLQHTVDFGASDSPDVIHELAPGEDQKYLFFPSVVGAVVPVVNLPGLSGDIAFTPETLAGIYLGKIKRWNDPALTKINRGVRLPDLEIIVVHRADGSGTSYAWTDYLAKASPEWKTLVGTSLAPKWPIGREASGNDGVSKLVKDQVGSIGYVEFIYALQNKLAYSRVRNRAGEFVTASLESIAAAANHSLRNSSDFKVSIVDPSAAAAYPISTFTWIIVPSNVSDPAKRDALKAFLHWMVGPAQRQAAALGYLPLPEDIVTKENSAIDRLR